MTPRLDLATMIALVLSVTLPSGACASLAPPKFAPDACDRALAPLFADCALRLEKADEASQAAILDECKARIDALPECR